jgi:hypothetical protein
MTKRILVLVEGQTEERFVKSVLAPWLLSLNVHVSPTILETRRRNDGTRFKGGVTTYSRFRRDVRRLLGSRGSAFVTTLLDYYGLPDDFPGMDSRPIGSATDRVESVERAIAADLGNVSDFRPFLALHEFEAWLFANEIELPSVLALDVGEQEFVTVCRSYSSPEEINERPTHAPSKRIARLAPSYRKALHGPVIAERIGIPKIRAVCPHADGWFTDMENFARR